MGFVDSPRYDTGTVSIYDNVTETSGTEHSSDQITYSQITSYGVGVAIDPNPIRSKTPPKVPPRTKITQVVTKPAIIPDSSRSIYITKKADDDSGFRSQNNSKIDISNGLRSGSNSKTDINSGLRSGSNSKTDVSSGLRSGNNSIIDVSNVFRSGNNSKSDISAGLRSGSKSKRNDSGVRFSSDSARVFGLDVEDQSHGRRTWPGRARPPSIIAPAPQPARSCEDNRFLHLNFSLLVDLKWFEKVCKIHYYFLCADSILIKNLLSLQDVCIIRQFSLSYSSRISGLWSFLWSLCAKFSK